jgi:hypothetical protein
VPADVVILSREGLGEFKATKRRRMSPAMVQSTDHAKYAGT